MNSGVGRASKVLQRILGLSVGGVIGDREIAAAKRHFTADLIARVCDERLAFLKSLKTWPVFGKGWNRRVAEVRAAALAMADTPPRLDSPRPAPSRAGDTLASLLARFIGLFRKAA